jgi:hypothetical protein
MLAVTAVALVATAVASVVTCVVLSPFPAATCCRLRGVPIRS